jgi:hypothetical protein
MNPTSTLLKNMITGGIIFVLSSRGWLYGDFDWLILEACSAKREYISQQTKSLHRKKRVVSWSGAGINKDLIVHLICN